MSLISESILPGVGRKFQVETLSGDRLVIVIHDDGTRELYHFSRKSMDRPASVLRLSDGEARQIAGIVGGLTYVPRSLPTAEVILEDLVLGFAKYRVHSACTRRVFDHHCQPSYCRWFAGGVATVRRSVCVDFS